MFIKAVIYQLELLKLWVVGEIPFAQWRQAAWHRPMAVCGRDCVFVLEDMVHEAARAVAQLAAVQLFAGLMMVAGALGYLAYLVEYETFIALVGGNALWAYALVLAGLALAIDASLAVMDLAERDDAIAGCRHGKSGEDHAGLA